MLLDAGASLAAQTPSTPRTTSCADSQSTDTTVYTLAGLTEPPIVRRGIPPNVPPSLLRLGIRLQTVVSVIVNPDGRVDSSSVVLVDSSRTAFDAEAVRVARGTVFWPGCRYTQAVRVRIQF